MYICFWTCSWVVGWTGFVFLSGVCPPFIHVISPTLYLVHLLVYLRLVGKASHLSLDAHRRSCKTCRRWRTAEEFSVCEASTNRP